MKKIFCIFLVFLLCGCDLFMSIKGSKNIVTRTINTGDFNTISTSGGYKIVHSSDISTSKIEVTTDDNLFDYLKIEVKNGSLNISVKDGYSIYPTEGVIVKTSLANVEEVDSSGSLELNVNGIDKERFSINSSGSLDANLSGKVTYFTLDSSGNVNLNAGLLECSEVVLSSSGSISAVVRASLKLELNISGNGSIEYYGNPSIVQNTTGNVVINKLGN